MQKARSLTFKHAIWKLLASLGILILSVIFSFAVNFLLVDPLVNSDSNYYDVNNTTPNILFTMFYELSGDTRYHAEPSLFNFLVTAGIGLLIGVGLAVIKWRKKS